MVPNGWSITSLGNSVTLMQSGLSRKLSNEDIGLPVIRSGNIGESFTTFDDIKYWYSEDPQGANTNDYVLQENDILVNFINSTSQIGKTCLFHNLIERPCIYTTNLLRLQAAEVVDVHFLFYVTKTSHYDKYVQSITKPAVNQASFTTKEFRAFEFLLPPLNEQRKIAQILSIWDKAIATTERLLANKQQQKKALMQRLLTGKQRFAGFEGEWHNGNLNMLCTLKGGNAFKEDLQGSMFGDYPFIKVSDMNLVGNETYIFTSNNWLSADIAANIRAKPFPKGSIVFAKVGAALLLNRRRILTRETIIDNNMMAAVPKDGVDTQYLYQLLLSIDFAKLVQEGAVPSVNQSDLCALKVRFPPYEEQRKIAHVLMCSDNQIEKTLSQLENLKLQKKALMQQLLTGKRRVKVDEATA